MTLLLRSARPAALLLCAAALTTGPACEREEDPRAQLTQAVAAFDRAAAGGPTGAAGAAESEPGPATVEHRIDGVVFEVPAPRLEGFTYRRLEQLGQAADQLGPASSGVTAEEKVGALALQASTQTRWVRALTAEAVSADARALNDLGGLGSVLGRALESHRAAQVETRTAGIDGVELAQEAAQETERAQQADEKARAADARGEEAATRAARLQSQVDTLKNQALDLRNASRGLEVEARFDKRAQAAELEAQAVGLKARADGALAEAASARIQARRWSAEAEALRGLVEALETQARATDARAQASRSSAQEWTRRRDAAVAELERSVLRNAAAWEVGCQPLFDQALERAGQAVALAGDAETQARGDSADVALLVSLSARYARASALTHRAAGQAARLSALGSLRQPLDAIGARAPAVDGRISVLREALAASATRADQEVSAALDTAAEAAEAFNSESEEGVLVAQTTAGLERLRGLVQAVKP
ncbi:MAG: hypothetical protein AAF288_04405 [Planctomycetota bacterium]